MNPFKRINVFGTAGILSLAALTLYSVYSVVLKPDVGDLIAASMHNDASTMKQCLGSGVDVNGREKWGWYGENYGRTPLTAALASGNVFSISRLLEAGADVNVPDGFGETPACAAARRGDADIIRLLSDAGADFSVICEKKYPVEMAIELGHMMAGEEIRKILEKRTRTNPE